jgi:hypothetical protein
MYLASLAGWSLDLNCGILKMDNNLARQYVKQHRETNFNLKICVSWICEGYSMHDNTLIAKRSPTIDLIFLVETWEEGGIGKAKQPTPYQKSVELKDNSNGHYNALTRFFW